MIGVFELAEGVEWVGWVVDSRVWKSSGGSGYRECSIKHIV